MPTEKWTSRKATNAFLFDMDGLLLDSERMSYEAWLSVGRAYGIDIEPVYPLVIGKGIKICDEIFQSHFGPDVPIVEMRAKKNDLLRASMEKRIPPKEGAIELLAFLNAKSYRTALVTSSLQPEAEFRLVKAGIGHNFTTRIFGGDVKHGKPAPDLYLLAAAKLNVEPRTCVVFEDSHSGLQSALSAGMTVVMIPDILPPENWVSHTGVIIKRSLAVVMRELEASGSLAQ
ncbi:MAG: HAD family phosphatase [Proteobacteria bacterium]|nr:HAD family phosphatase [Pseudomonadota bacterium]